jgi:hypothetical protein
MSNQLQVSGEAKIRTIQGPVVANSGVITALDGDASQYVRGDGTLADFPTSTGGGSSVSYYLNTSVSQGTIGGVAYKQLSKVPISGAGTDVTISANGYIASYLTDANDPALLEVPAGNFNCEFYFSVNSNAHNPYVYAEVYKYDGTTFTLLGSNVSIPQYLSNGTTLSPYYFAIAVSTSVLTVTDRIAIRIYVNVDGKTVTLHTENNHLCQVVTTFSKGIISLNNLTRQNQFFGTGTSGTDFAISSSVATHTFNLPVASATNTGKLSSTDWSTFNGKVPYTGATANVDLGAFSLSGDTISGVGIFSVGSGTQSGYIGIKQGTTFLGNISGYNSINANATKFILISDIGSTNYKSASFQLSSLTNNTERTFTLPDISGTLALLEGSQTFSGSKTFSSSIKADSGILLKNGFTTYSNGYTSLGGDIGNLIISSSIGGTPYDNEFSFTSSTSNTYTFPNASGTIALTSNLSSYVPYTGATTNVDLGANYITSATIVFWKGTGTGLGNIGLGRIVPLGQNTTGQGNIGIGESSLFFNTTGSNNIAIGVSSTQANTTGINNIGIGLGSNSNNVTGSGNVAVGVGSLNFNTTNYNTAVGHLSLYFNTTGTNNVAVGNTSLYTNTTGAQNTALGAASLYYNTTGSNNTAIGNVALQQNTTGVNNTAIGSFSSYLNTTGQNNTSVGASSLSANTIGQYNTAIGSASLNANTTAFYNTAIGYASLNLNTTGESNVAVGGSALGVNTTGQYNVAVGRSASNGNTTGNYNTALGGQALANVTTGSQNIAIGYNAGGGITTGSQNTIIGIVTGLSSTLSNNIILADGAGNIRYQWNGTNNVFTGAATFSSSVTAGGKIFTSASVNDNILEVINSDTTNGYGLYVRGGGTATNRYVARFKNGADNDVMWIGNTGNVGIGISTGFNVISGTETTLQIAGGNVASLYLNSTGSNKWALFANASGSLGVYNLTASTIPFTIASTGAATFSSDVTIGPSNGSFKGFGHSVNVSSVSQGGLFPYSGVTGSGADYSPTLFADGSNNLYFCAGGSTAKKMTITSGGSVGIGTSAPITKLQISNVSGADLLSFGISDYQAWVGGKIDLQGISSFGADMAFYTHPANSSNNATVVERMRIKSNGTVGIGITTGTYNGRFCIEGDGTTTSNVHLEMSTDANRSYLQSANRTFIALAPLTIGSSSIIIEALAGSGSRTVTASADGTLSASSDSTLKQEDKEYKIQGLAEILQLKPRAYKWLSDIEIRGEEATTEIGFFADEVNPIIPSAAPKGNDNLYGFYDRAVIAALVKAIQEQQAMITSLQEHINELKNK